MSPLRGFFRSVAFGSGALGTSKLPQQIGNKPDKHQINALTHPDYPDGESNAYDTAMTDSMPRGLQPMTRWIIVLLMLSPLALAVPVLIQPEPEEPWLEADSSPDPLPARTDGERLTVQELRPIAGFAINAHHIGDLSLYLKSVEEIANLGANALIVLTPMIQPYVSSNSMDYVPGKCATDEQLVAILNRARDRGLHTTLLPIVLIEHPGEKEWRGVIQPENWDEWWTNYDKFVDRFVNVAVQADVDLLVIGSELNSTEKQRERWERIAKRVREQFRGQITYSANWDRYHKIDLWDLVDVMCVSSYFELERDDPQATEMEIVRAWADEREDLIDFANELKMPLVLSEVGYPSLPWASAHPWNYVAKKGAEADHEAQAKCWRAFFRAWTKSFLDKKGPAAGFFGYAWSPYYHGDAWDTGYGIQGKPAYDIVRNGFARLRAEDD